MSDPSDPNLEPVDPPVPEPVEPAPAPAPEPEPAEPAEPTEPSAAPANGIEKRFSTYAERLRQAEARTARYERMLETLLTQGVQPKSAAPEPPPAPPIEPLPPRPKRENFADPDAYDAAIDEYQDKKLARQLAIARAEDEQHRKALTEQQQREAAERAQRTEIQRREEAWGQRMAKAEAEEPEWFDAYETVGNSITPVMGDAIKRAPDGVALVMYLHKNPEIRQKIAELRDPVSALLEMGKIEAQLTRPEPVVPPRQAPPMRPVGQRSAGSVDRDIYTIGNEQGGMNEYAAKRLEQMEAARRARH